MSHVDTSADSDLEDVPGPEHFRPQAHKWRPPGAAGRTRTSRNVTSLELDGERVEWTLNDVGHALEIRLVVLRVPVAQDDSVAQIVKQGSSEYLYIHDEERFVGRGRFTGLDHLNFSARSKLVDVRAVLLREFQIDEVVVDELSDRRNADYDTWLQCMGKVVEESNPRDVLEVYKIYKKFAGRGRDKSVEILECMANDSSLSGQIKKASEKLAIEERKIVNRNEKICSFTEQTRSRFLQTGILNQLRDVYSKVVENHYKSLEKEFRSSACFMEIIARDLKQLKNEPLALLRFGVRDIKTFVALAKTADQFRITSYLKPAFHRMWTTFFENIRRSDTVQTLVTLIYPFLFKSFMEAITQIGAKTGRQLCAEKNPLLMVEPGPWDLNSISWFQEASVLDRLLEKECRFLVHMAGHTKPGVALTSAAILNCDVCTPSDQSGQWYQKMGRKVGKMITKKVRQLLPGNTGSEKDLESLVWVTVMKSSMTYLLGKSPHQAEDNGENSPYEDLVESLSDAYTTYVESCDSSESRRVTARDVVKFAAQMLDHVTRISRPEDVALLASQTGFVRALMSAQSQYAKYLPTLIAEFVRYWENRKSFDASIGGKFTHGEFARQLTKTCDVLHATLNVVLAKRHLAPDLVLDYLRSFNEFVANFQCIDFTWLVETDSLPKEFFSASTAMEISGTKNTTHYEITDHAAFVTKLTDAKRQVPKHYVLAVVGRLTTLVAKCLEHGEDEEVVRVKGTTNLLTAIQNAFIHLKDQVDYTSFHQFETDICEPFEQIAKQMSPYARYKQDLDALENFYLYTRKQDQIDIAKALAMCGDKTKSGVDGFDRTFGTEVLKKSFKMYEDSFNACIKNQKADDILTKLKGMMEERKLSDWDASFKREKVPLLLAAVSAFWSIKKSVHVTCTGRSIKPHCIQILCVLRLLSVDRDDVRGLRNHLAEVLTGQGKSLVLGLLASVLALTGNSVRLVCYSKYLATRDQEAFKEFFAQLGIGRKIEYGTFGDLANKVLCVEMNGKSHNARGLLEKMILDTLEPGSAVKFDDKNQSTVLLVDEVDVFFTKEFYGNVYRPLVNPGMEAFCKVQEMIWETVAIEQDAKRVRQKLIEYAEKIFVDDKDKIFSQFYASTPRSFFEMHLDKMISEATFTRNGTDDDWYINKFKLNEENIIVYRDENGMYSTSLRSSYYNVFNYFRLKEKDFDHKGFQNYGYLNVHCGQVSYAQLPLEYPVILGVSGTISTLSGEEKTVVQVEYKIKDVSCMPTFFGGVTLKFDPHLDFSIRDDEGGWQDAILRSVQAKQGESRAVLVVFNTDRDIAKFTQRFHDDLTRVETLTGNEKAADLERRVNDAGVARSVTLAIRSMGRGVDYKTSKVVEANGGVHVIQTFLSLDVKEEVQIKGRTARKDNKGSYEMILCKKHLIDEKFLSEGDKDVGYARLDEIRKNKEVENYRENKKQIEGALKNHNATLELLKSFAGYKQGSRADFFSKYPFVTET